MIDIFLRRSRRPASRLNASCSLRVEALEDRAVPATITVAGAGRFQDNGIFSLVNTGGDNYTAVNLRSAIIGADSMRGADTILLENGTYDVGSMGQFIVGDNSGMLTIKNNAGGVSTIDAHGNGRIFLNQASLSLSGLKLQNGLASDRGGAIFNNGTLTVTNCQFVNNEAASGWDGGPAQGGAIFNYANRTLTIHNSLFSGNSARGGDSSVLLGGTADAQGGAVYLMGSLPNLAFSQVALGFTTLNLSSVYPAIANPASVTITSSTFANNQALGGHGVLFNGYGARGGSAWGGALYAAAGTYDLSILDSTFSGNTAQGGNGKGGTGTTALATSGDGGNAWGGALYLQAGGRGDIRLANDTIAFNKAAGGLGNGPLALNGGGAGGGLADNYQLFLTSPMPKVINTIVAKNQALIAADVSGIFASLGNNLIGDSVGAAGSFNAFTGDFTGTTFAPLDPGLDPLGNYGGPTPTHRLKAGSFAIDRGNNLVTAAPTNLTLDQRGLPRRSGVAVDIGTYEVTQPGQDKTYTTNRGVTLTATPATGVLAGLNNPLGKTLTVQLVTAPAAGKLTLQANGSFTYTPPVAFVGTVTYRFRVLVDGVATDTFTVSVKVL